MDFHAENVELPGYDLRRFGYDMDWSGYYLGLSDYTVEGKGRDPSLPCINP